MICYAHPDMKAAGICRTCGKGMCKSCAEQFITDAGLVCSATCRDQAVMLQTMNERAYKIYGIGDSKPRGLPTNVLMPAVMGLGFCVWGLVDLLMWKTPLSIFMPGMGALFLFGAWYGWRKYREHGLNV